MMKRCTDVVIAIAAAIKKVWWQTINAAWQPTLRRLWPSTSQFSSRKVPDCCHRTGFVTGMTPQSTLLPQSRNSNGGEGVETICHPPYSPNIAPSDFFSLGE